MKYQKNFFLLQNIENMAVSSGPRLSVFIATSGGSIISYQMKNPRPYHVFVPSVPPYETALVVEPEHWNDALYVAAPPTGKVIE